MKALKSKVTKGISVGTLIPTCDNSGAKLLKVIAVKRAKTVKRRNPSAGVSEMIFASVKSGNKEMRKQVVPAIVVRQKKEYRRSNGMRIKFEDNAAVVLKDNKGNPKGTIFKGPIAKEAAARWPQVAKVAKIIV